MILAEERLSASAHRLVFRRAYSPAWRTTRGIPCHDITGHHVVGDRCGEIADDTARFTNPAVRLRGETLRTKASKKPSTRPAAT